MPPDSAPQRTRLSWRRTTLSATAVLVLLIRLALLQDNRAVAITVTALGALSWVTLLAVVQRRIYALGQLARPSRWILILVAAVCACFGALGVVLALA
ncbi:hypothetical protein Rhe02_26610 [Rhizocola hellebori]|uniref:DUF202 domain-containing protein n=1 Tax=Rhizocola hellebori TaxID=1392758 RepID=A0A8J3Q721_9ACTN|nr:DUF202 domain-containing protein [Rhizocola hellebori]GIH04594.1 hypothetical protein Rhe02_26610 [Rhizocola hellebori]